LLGDGQVVEGLAGGGGAFLEGEIEGTTLVSVPPTMTDASIEAMRAALTKAWPDRPFHIVTNNIEFLAVEKVPEQEAVEYLAAWERWKAAEQQDAARAKQVGDQGDGRGPGVCDDGDSGAGAAAGVQPGGPVAGSVDDHETESPEGTGRDPSVG